jgi:hypothetical protein
VKSSAHKVVALFFVTGLGFGLLSAIISNVFSSWVWVGPGVALAFAISVSAPITIRLQWIFLNLSVARLVSAALIIIAAYLLSVLAMITGQVAYEALYAKIFPMEWQEQVHSGSYAYTMLPLYLATVVSAILVSSALRVLTRRWERQVMLLLIIGGIVTIPVSRTLASLIAEPNWHLVIFPVGEALFGALSGYWLVRASSAQKAEAN